MWTHIFQVLIIVTIIGASAPETASKAQATERKEITIEWTLRTDYNRRSNSRRIVCGEFNGYVVGQTA
jgi:hypothetical protein